MAIALDTWDTPTDRTPGDFKRDQRGTPYVSHPDGDQVKTGPRKGEPKWVRYGRPSSFGKDIENTKALERWNERQVAIGMCVPSDELTAALLRLAELDPTSDEGKDAADGVVVLAKRLAKAGLAAERGTHMHQVTEDDDTDQDWLHRAERGAALDVPHHVQAAMLEAWRLMTVAYDLEVIEVEQAVVHDGYRQAGTLDRIARLRRDITWANGDITPAGTVVVLDLKTGKMTRQGDRIEYWHSYVIQCATYAAATPYDTATDQRTAWDYEVSQQHAIIAHLPVDEAMAGKATCRLVLADIEAGRKAIESVILPAREWQAKRDLFAFTHPDEPAVEIDIEQPAEDTSDPFEGLPNATQERSVRHVFSVNPITLERPKVTTEGDEISEAQHNEIRKRVLALDPQSKALLTTLAKESSEAGHPFSIAAGKTLRRWHIYRALLRLAGHFAADLEADHIRATLALVLPEVEQPGIPLGPAIGSLTTDEAQRFVHASIQVIAADAALTFDDSGHPKWLGLGNPAA